jgi:ribosomal protein S18 acetylase RimI-like enzyme
MTDVNQRLFNLSGYHIKLLQAADQSELQTLLEKCADYTLLVTGSPPKPSAASSLLVDCPPGKTVEDKVVIGISAEKQGLMSVLDTIKDYPNPGDWWLGLLLIDPAHRNKGLGKQIYQSFEHWASQLGARRIFLGVVEENQKAARFWQSLGFEIIERQPVRQFGNRAHAVITMVRDISGE